MLPGLTPQQDEASLLQDSDRVLRSVCWLAAGSRFTEIPGEKSSRAAGNECLWNELGPHSNPCLLSKFGFSGG